MKGVGIVKEGRELNKDKISIQRFQHPRFDRESPDFICCLQLYPFLSNSPDLS